MATFENTVMIRRPVADVFAFLADFENIPKCNYAIVETHKMSQGSVDVRTIYQQVRSVPSRSEERFEVTATTRPASWRYKTNSGTPVTNTVELELRGPGRVLGRVAVPRVRDAVAANLQKLKEVLER